MPETTARALFAARLAQARQLRGLSQRALGDRMGLGKDKGSSRINRYEHQVTAIGFDNLDKLAEVLDVPVAYLVAENPSMADGILELSRANATEQERLVLALRALVASPPLAEAIARVAAAPDDERSRLAEALAGLVTPPAKKQGK